MTRPQPASLWFNLFVQFIRARAFQILVAEELHMEREKRREEWEKWLAAHFCNDKLSQFVASTTIVCLPSA
jgi:hypothetical protein